MSTLANDVLAGPFLDGLALSNITRSARLLVRLDALMAARAAGTATMPIEGAGITPDAADASPRWALAKASDDGSFAPEVARGGYLRCTRLNPSDKPIVMVLEASGHAMVYVNGEPRMGDPYSTAYVALPIVLHPGENELLFAPAGRGPLRASLRAPTSSIELDTRDLTLPDVARTPDGSSLVNPYGEHFALPVRNCTTQPQAVQLLTRTPGGPWRAGSTHTLPPLSTLKLPAFFVIHNALSGAPAGDALRVEVAALPAPKHASAQHDAPIEALESNVLAQASFDVALVAFHSARRVTFVSHLDNSVQYYAVVPPSESFSPQTGLVLSLHGASVEAIDQARAYSPKPDLWVVCPTNRRPFGFDWEDWGRADALEVLRHATDAINRLDGRSQLDPRRVYLTGHSMGGHGTWQLASLFPDRFAAAAPSAGWISFATYPQASEPSSHPMAVASQRAASTSNTLAMRDNLSALGLFVLHGDADDNVPVSQARTMRDALQDTHPDLAWHEEPGAGHWWDSGEFGPLPGAACVDFPPVFELFARRRLPDAASINKVSFTTLNPAVSSGTRVVTIVDQLERLTPSKVELAFTKQRRVCTITATNVRTLVVHVGEGPATVRITINTQQLDAPVHAGTITLQQSDGLWSAAATPDDAMRMLTQRVLPGSFKAGYEGFVLIYGTTGTPEENAANYARARFDAEQWWVRGNGFATLLPDTQPVPGTANIVLYGNADTNRAWRRLLGGTSDSRSLVTASRGSVRVGLGESARTLTGSNLALLALQRLDEHRIVTLVGTTGPAGNIVSSRVPTFVSGAGIAEVTVLSATMLGAPSMEDAWNSVLIAENAQD